MFGSGEETNTPSYTGIWFDIDTTYNQVLNTNCGHSGFIAGNVDVAKIYIEGYWNEITISSANKYVSMIGELGGVIGLAQSVVYYFTIFVLFFGYFKCFRKCCGCCCKNKSDEAHLDDDRNMFSDSD